MESWDWVTRFLPHWICSCRACHFRNFLKSRNEKKFSMKKELYHAATLHLTNSTGCLWLASAKRNDKENIPHQEDRWKCHFGIRLLQELLCFLLKILIPTFNEGLCIMRVQKWLKESKCTLIIIVHNCSQSVLMCQCGWKIFIKNSCLTIGGP